MKLTAKRFLLLALTVCLTAAMLLSVLSGCKPLEENGSLSGTWSNFQGSSKLTYEIKKNGECIYTLVEAVNDSDFLSECYWSDDTPFYHIYDDCKKINHTDTLYSGTISSAQTYDKTNCCAECTERYMQTHLSTTHSAKGTWTVKGSELIIVSEDDSVIRLRYELKNDVLALYDPDDDSRPGIFYRE